MAEPDHALGYEIASRPGGGFSAAPSPFRVNRFR